MFTPNLPNYLTVLRIFLVPVLVVALLVETPSGDVVAAVVFSFASVTDAVDGYIARSRNLVTDFGKLMDPVADKLLILAALLSLVSLGRLQAWVAMVIVAREFAVTVTRMAVTSQGVVGSNWWGKTKTIVQVTAVFFLIAIRDSPVWLDVLVYFTVAITLVSGVDYFFGLRRMSRERERNARRAAAA